MNRSLVTLREIASYDPLKKCFSIASTTDEHKFLFELSLSRLFNQVFYFCLSFKHIEMLKFSNFFHGSSVMAT